MTSTQKHTTPTTLVRVLAHGTEQQDSLCEAVYHAPFHDDYNDAWWDSHYARYRITSVPSHSRHVHLYDICLVALDHLMPEAYRVHEASGYKTLRISPLSPVQAWKPALVAPFLKTLGLPLNWHEDGVCVGMPKHFNTARIDLLRSRFDGVLLMEVV